MLCVCVPVSAVVPVLVLTDALVEAMPLLVVLLVPTLAAVVCVLLVAPVVVVLVVG